MELSHRDVVTHGLNLRRITNDPSFKLLFEVLREQYTTELLNSQFHEKDKREKMYFLLGLLTDLEATINTFVSVAEQDALNSQTDTDEE